MGNLLLNLQTFLDYRKYCPFCETPLDTKFRTYPSLRTVIPKNRENSLDAFFYMRSIDLTHNSYEAHYVFDKSNNSFLLEFCSKNDQKILHTSSKILNQFKEFNDNVGLYFFEKECRYCWQYKYFSNYFKLDIDKMVVSKLEVNKEYFSFPIKGKEGYFIDIINDYDVMKSYLSIIDKRYIYPSNTKITGPIIPFISVEETGKRLKNLLTFF